MPTHIEYRTRGPRWNGNPYLSLASAQHELTALLPGRYRIEQRTVTTTEWLPLAAARDTQDGECRAPHCWSEYGTSCATCPKEKR